jgi:uncharacterized protein (TIGR00255 family)
MSTYSMTGFGRGEASGQIFVLTTEIKSVNNRFREYKFKMPQAFNLLEMDLRSKLEVEFKRGSFDISISYKRNSKSINDFQIDEQKVQAYLSMIKSLAERNHLSLQINPTEFLRSDFIKEEESKESELLELAMSSFKVALSAIKLSRSQEGDKLVAKLREHLEIYESGLAQITHLKSLYPEILKEKLANRLQEKLKDVKVDESRFMQEIIYYLEKLEIDEEINRATIHLGKLKNLLKTGGEMGRQIDFLLQELGRETNTIGSKSAQTEISSHVVEMKVQLEKIREQALNLE